MKIFFLSNSSNGGYGYSILVKNLMYRLRKKHKIINFGLQTMGDIVKDDLGNNNLPLFFDIWGADALSHYLKAYDPEVIITAFDIWVPGAKYLPDVIKQFKNLIWIHHCTVNTAPLSPFLIPVFQNPNILVAPSGFVETLLKTIFMNVVKIPHGVDTKIYRPNPKFKEEMKEKLGYKDKFVILCVNRNKGPQKNFPDLFHTYKTLLLNVKGAKENTILHIHSYANEPEGYPLEVLRDRAGLTEWVKLTKVKPSEDWEGIEICHENDKNAMPHNPNFRLTEEEMAKLYNMADVHIVPSGGESFSFPVLESMACGVPNIVPNFSAHGELVNISGAGLSAKLRTTTTTPHISDMGLVDELNMAECVNELYTKPDLREELGKKGVEFAKNYDWSKIILIWEDLLRKLEVPTPISYATGQLGI